MDLRIRPSPVSPGRRERERERERERREGGREGGGGEGEGEGEGEGRGGEGRGGRERGRERGRCFRLEGFCLASECVLLRVQGLGLSQPRRHDVVVAIARRLPHAVQILASDGLGPFGVWEAG